MAGGASLPVQGRASRANCGRWIRAAARPETQLRPSTQVELISPHANSLNCLDVDRIGQNFAIVGGSDGKISLFDLRSGFKNTFRSRCRIEKLKLSGRGTHSSSVSSVQWFPLDCGAFASSSYDASVKFWDAENFIPVVDFKFQGYVSCSRIHGAGRLIACGVDGSESRLCDLRTGGSTHVFTAHRRNVTSIDFCPSHPHIMATASLDKSIKIFDIRKGSSKGVLLCLDWRSGGAARREDAGVAHDSGALSLKFKPCGTVLVSAGADGCVRAWDPATGALLDSKANAGTRWHTSTYDIEIAAPQPGVSRDTLLFVPGRREGDISATRMEANSHTLLGGRSTERLVGHVRMVRGLRYLPMRNKLISVGSEGLILLWESAQLAATESTYFKGEDPAEMETKRRRVEAALPVPPGPADTDDWSHVEDSAVGSAGAAVAPSGEGTRFLPPIIRQMLEEEQRIRPGRGDTSRSALDR